ncbi:hypothetical protein [Vibrio harveyi]|uniref:hypothetical protein n=1 Tax=Vibrio harveyi TaxID=669 RepID=UPI0006809D2F
MKLTQLQSIIFFELSDSKTPLTGYDITKMVNAKGLPYSHQHIYRDANKMPLKRKLIPQDGKPDRKVMSIDPSIDYEIDATHFHIETLLAYQIPELIEQKSNHLRERIKALQEQLDILLKTNKGGLNNAAIRICGFKLVSFKKDLEAIEQP